MNLYRKEITACKKIFTDMPAHYRDDKFRNANAKQTRGT